MAKLVKLLSPMLRFGDFLCCTHPSTDDVVASRTFNGKLGPVKWTSSQARWSHTKGQLGFQRDRFYPLGEVVNADNKELHLFASQRQRSKDVEPPLDEQPWGLKAVQLRVGICRQRSVRQIPVVWGHPIVTLVNLQYFLIRTVHPRYGQYHPQAPGILLQGSYSCVPCQLISFLVFGSGYVFDLETFERLDLGLCLCQTKSYKKGFVLYHVIGSRKVSAIEYLISILSRVLSTTPTPLSVSVDDPSTFRIYEGTSSSSKLLGLCGTS
ncbi:hypothetical protein Nepgr_011625 [Nepenthes gracilis]|uniref:Uncharacterized protein n=1 Tax=Nepenthes gracilis TaxID=150966 RepID=A0AAD3SFM6_NEPGR|nr:hypothetical protein Nepgr_011625 [Nepenthes gracilis]